MSTPSFSSFPPSFSSFPEINPDKSDPSPIDRSKREKKKKHNRTRTSDEKGSKDRHYHKSEKGRHCESKKLIAPRSYHAESYELEGTNTIFYSDSKGDRMNIQYGGLHAGDIPRYRMVAGGRHVLGLPSGLVILRRMGKGVEVGAASLRKAASLSTSATQALLSRPSRHLVPTSNSRKHEEIDGYIAFPSRTRDDSHLSFWSISQKEGENSDSSNSSEIESLLSSEENDSPIILSSHQETLKRLQQEVETKPECIETWFVLLNQTLSTVPITSKNARKTRSEISSSIISRALSSSPQNAKNKRLRLAYLRAGEEIWHESRLRSEWDDALKLQDIELCMEWLEWTIRKGQTGVDGFIEAAVRILDKIDSSAEMDKVRIFWRLVTAVKMAGYTERATAMFQAQAELSFNLPSGVRHMPFQAQLDELGEFWDSEHPRFGEDAASGWTVWYSSKAEYGIPYNPPNSTQPQYMDLDPYRQWAGQELELDRKMLLPSRSDTDSLDPYATILFSDIRPILVRITSLAAKHAFRMAWLSFLGLNLPGFSLGTREDLHWDDRWNLGYTTTPHFLTSLFPLDSEKNYLSTDSVAGIVIGREKQYKASFGPVRCWGEDVCGPLDLACVHPGKVLGRGFWSKEDLMDIDDQFVRRIFRDSKFAGDDPEWITMTLAFETASNPNSAIKLSRSLLSANQASLVLWNSHAQLERLRGRPGEARNVYHTVLISAQANKSSKDVGEMWWNWAEMEWLYGNDKQAMEVLLRAAGMEAPATGVTILRAKRALEDIVQSNKASHLWKDYGFWIKLRALLELLGGNEPEDSIAVFDRYSLPEPKNLSESLVTASLVMIYCHGIVLKRRMTPAILIQRAHLGFEQYPNNSIILGILLEAERGQGVWGRVRSMLGDTGGKTAKDVSRRIEEVWIAGWESGRWLAEAERTRNGLEAAVEHERTRFSWVIWRIYIEFEIQVKELRRAKKLLFRSIGECPMVKELYLLAFGPLRSVFQKHELNALADTMAERGIRLRQGLDEIVGSTGVMDEERADKEGLDSEDEIEYNAKELRRLMPY